MGYQWRNNYNIANMHGKMLWPPFPLLLTLPLNHFFRSYRCWMHANLNIVCSIHWLCVYMRSGALVTYSHSITSFGQVNQRKGLSCNSLECMFNNEATHGQQQCIYECDNQPQNLSFSSLSLLSLCAESLLVEWRNCVAFHVDLHSCLSNVQYTFRNQAPKNKYFHFVCIKLSFSSTANSTHIVWMRIRMREREREKNRERKRLRICMAHCKCEPNNICEHSPKKRHTALKATIEKYVDMFLWYANNVQRQKNTDMFYIDLFFRRRSRRCCYYCSCCCFSFRCISYTVS